MIPNSEFAEAIKSLRVAIVHDWMFSRRGGEKVLEQIADLFPKATIFYLFGTPEKVLKLKNSHSFVPSFLASMPKIQKFYKLLLPLFPTAIESFDLSKFDLILSTSSCVAKGIIPSPNAVHLSYIHSPMRYAWDQEHFYFTKKPKFSRPFELLRRIFLNHLRTWDVVSSIRSDSMIANSAFVARRIKLYYGREAEVVHPPVNVNWFLNCTRSENSPSKVLLFGAWVVQKRMFEALEVLINDGVSVICAGQGEEIHKASSKYQNHPLVEFHFSPSDEQLRDIFERAHTFLFPALEDFGIAPVEAMAAGLPVVAPDRGGTAETVVDGRTGFLFKEGDFIHMLATVKKSLSHSWTPDSLKAIREHAKIFSELNFQQNYMREVLRLLAIKDT